MAKFHSIESLKAERKAQNITREIKAKLVGQDMTVQYNYGDTAVLTKEILTSADGAKALVEKVVLDVENGREAVPDLYPFIYDVRQDATYPRFVSVRHALRGRVVFLQRLEGEDVKLGTMDAKNKDVVELVTYSAGFQYTREMELFNELFSLAELNTAMGEANSARLNDVHFNPIITATYAAANKQAAVTTNPLADVHVRDTIEAAVIKSTKLLALGGTFSVLLINQADQFRVERALSAQTINGTNYSANSTITDVIQYKGWVGNVGDKTYTFNGVPAGKAYLIRPKLNGFKSFIKENLTIESGTADVTKGLRDAIVGHTTVGTFAGIDDNVIEITLP